MPPPESLEHEVAEAVRFRSGPLALEGRLWYPEAAAPAGGVVLAGPHPLLGGDMENNVVRGVASGLARRGAAVLTFNYRGVGGSEGEKPDVAEHLAEFWATSHICHDPAYADDLRAAVVAMREFAGELSLALAGYSFGCSLLPAAGAGHQVPLVLIAPTVGTHDYEAFRGTANPLLVVAPDRDFAADAARLAEWFHTLTALRRLVRGEWDDHFFRGFEDELAGVVHSFLHGQWGVGG